MASVSRLLVLGVLLYTTTVLLACRGTTEEAKPAESVLPVSAQTAPVRAIMAAIVDPAADVVWESVATILYSPTKIEERAPKNDEEWANVRRNAVMLLETCDLLLTPGRPVAGPGEKSVAPGIELEPEEIFANVNKDREKWNRLVEDYRQSILDVLQAIDAKDSKKLFDLGEGLDSTCENCHVTFWYPNQPLPEGFDKQ